MSEEEMGSFAKSVSFSLTKDEYLVFAIEAKCRGLTVSQYCKTAAFSYLAKYVSKGSIKEIVTLLEGQKDARNRGEV